MMSPKLGAVLCLFCVTVFLCSLLPWMTGFVTVDLVAKERAE